MAPVRLSAAGICTGQRVSIMAGKRDYYEILGIDKSADEAAIKKAYRKLAKKYHPDTNAGNPRAEQMFKDITEAYSILSDPQKRKLYDRFGHAAFDGTGAAAENAGSGFEGFGHDAGGYHTWHFEGGDGPDIFGDIFGDMFGGSTGGSFGGRSFHFNASDGFGGRGDRGFGSGAGFDGFSSRGQDLNADISVSFNDAAFGCDKVIRIQDASGHPQSLKVHIPAGIDEGKTIRLRGRGMAGMNGGGSGDLLIRVHVESRPDFRRQGMDVYSTVQIPFTVAVFGGEAVIPTLKGQVQVNIRPGTQSGTKIRLKGKGLVSMKDPSSYGDQYAVVEIQVPRHLSREAGQKLKEFEEACRRSGAGAA